MKINYPKVQIDTGEDIIKLKEEQLAPPALINIMERRTDGFLAGKAFFLDSDFDWIIVKDNQGLLCLVPLKKEWAIKTTRTGERNILSNGNSGSSDTTDSLRLMPSIRNNDGLL